MVLPLNRKDCCYFLSVHVSTLSSWLCLWLIVVTRNFVRYFYWVPGKWVTESLAWNNYQHNIWSFAFVRKFLFFSVWFKIMLRQVVKLFHYFLLSFSTINFYKSLIILDRISTKSFSFTLLVSLLPKTLPTLTSVIVNFRFVLYYYI